MENSYTYIRAYPEQLKH